MKSAVANTENIKGLKFYLKRQEKTDKARDSLKYVAEIMQLNKLAAVADITTRIRLIYVDILHQLCCPASLGGVAISLRTELMAPPIKRAAAVRYSHSIKMITAPNEP